MDSKKLRERKFVELAQEFNPEFPQGKLVLSESPDIAITAPDGSVGVEVTQLYQKPAKGQRPRQAMEREQWDIVNHAVQKYVSYQLPPLDVRVFFGNHPLLALARRRELGAKIADLVRRHLPQAKPWVVIENDFETLDVFPEEVSSISIAAVQGLERNFWSVPDAGFMQEDCSADIQRCLDSKESKLPLYRLHWPTNYLLVVAAGISPSTFFDPDTATLEQQYYSGFDNVYLLDSMRRMCHRLKISRRPR